MKTISGIDAIRMAIDVSNIEGGTFHLSFYPYNRTKGEASAKLKTRKDCTYRAQLPRNKFDVDGDNYFLFKNAQGEERTCYRVLLRYIAFPPDFTMRKVNWL